MIRNFQKSSDSNVDLAPIYLSLQTINNYLYNLDIQTTLSSAVQELSEKVDNLSPNPYITDSMLTTNLYMYNNYSNLQSTGPIVVYEPYIQSITNPDYLKGRNKFKYNLPNVTLNYTDSANITYENLTCNKIQASNIECSECKFSDISVKKADLYNVTADYLNANTARVLDCSINVIDIKSQGDIDNCLLYRALLNGCNLMDCYGYSIDGKLNKFENCTLNRFEDKSQTFINMRLNCYSTQSIFSSCEFNDVSIYDLTHTNFVGCTGTVYIPKIINGKNMFDNNNVYLGSSDYSYVYTETSTYTATTNLSYTFPETISTESSTTYTSTFKPATDATDPTNTYVDTSTWTTSYTAEYTEDLIENTTLTSNITSIVTQEQLLDIQLLPEYVIPNIFTNNSVAQEYYDTYVNIELYTNTLGNFTVNNCTGNYELYLTNLENSFNLTNNNLYKMNLNIDNIIGSFKLISNTIKDANIMINSEILADMSINSNSFDRLNISYNHTQTRNILAYNNTYDYLNIMPNVNGNFRMWNCNINNGYLNGYVALNLCTGNYIENSGEEHLFMGKINTLRAHKLNDIRSNTIGKLIIEPSIDDNPNKTFANNSIDTIICPANYTITNLTDNNTFNSIITY